MGINIGSSTCSSSTSSASHLEYAEDNRCAHRRKTPCVASLDTAGANVSIAQSVNVGFEGCADNERCRERQLLEAPCGDDDSGKSTSLQNGTDSRQTIGKLDVSSRLSSAYSKWDALEVEEEQVEEPMLMPVCS